MITPKEMSKRLQEIEARLKDTTPGKWLVEYTSTRPGGQLCCSETVYSYQPDGERFDIVGRVRNRLGPRQECKDAYFIANAPSDIQYLLDRVRELEAALQWYAAKGPEDSMYHRSGLWRRARQALEGSEEE